jgi:hypothetical protein
MTGVIINFMCASLVDWPDEKKTRSPLWGLQVEEASAKAAFLRRTESHSPATGKNGTS